MDQSHGTKESAYDTDNTQFDKITKIINQIGNEAVILTARLLSFLENGRTSTSIYTDSPENNS